GSTKPRSTKPARNRVCKTRQSTSFEWARSQPPALRDLAGDIRVFSLRRGRQVLRVFYFPDSVELHEVRLNRNAGEVCGEKFSGAEEFAAMMFGFGLAVAFEMVQATISGAVRMGHDHDAFGLVQVDGHADLFEDE